MDYDDILVNQIKELLLFDQYSSKSYYGMRYDDRIIDFFKRHNLYDKETFDYIQNNTKGVCYLDPDERVRIGCNCIKNSKNKLAALAIIIPDKTTDVTMLIQIHEIVHAILAYKHMGKEYDTDMTVEALSCLYEGVYLKEMNNESLYKFSKNLDDARYESDVEEYKFALFARDYLLSDYDYDIDHMQKLCNNLLSSYNYVKTKKLK